MLLHTLLYREGLEEFAENAPAEDFAALSHLSGSMCLHLLCTGTLRISVGSKRETAGPNTGGQLSSLQLEPGIRVLVLASLALIAPSIFSSMCTRELSHYESVVM